MSLLEGSSAGPAARTFVNRHRELTELRAALNAAVGGRGGLCLLSGEPGIGKTRLATELGAQAATLGVPALWGRCWEGGGAPAFWPWVQLVRGHLRAQDPHALAAELGSAAVHIARVVPEFADALEPVRPAIASDLDSEHDRFYLFDAVSTLFIRAASERGLVLIFDDLHAADMPSLLLLQFLAKELHDTRLLVLGTFRDTDIRRNAEHAELLLAIAREGSHLPLRGLAEADVAHLLGAERSLSPKAANRLHRLTEGNPFFIAEILRSGTVDDGLDDRALAHQALRAIPTGVRETIRQRLASLPEKDYDVLSVASVAGREFTVAVLQAVSERPVDQILDVLDRSLAEGVVQRLPQTLGGFRFSHALFREVLYDDLPTARRLALHRQVGEEAERWGAGHPEAHLPSLAHHFFEAASLRGVTEKAIDYAIRAGEQATSRVAYEDAITQFERALQLLELTGKPAPERRCDVLLALGHVQGKVGSHSRARETFLRAAALARSLGSGERLARAALRFGTESLIVEPFESGTLGGVDDDFVRLCEDALAALPADDSALRAKLLGRLAVALHWSPGSSSRRAELSREAVEMADRLRDVDALVFVLNTRCYAAWGPDNLEVRVAASRRMLELAESAGRKEDALTARLWLAFCELEMGDVGAADAHFDRIAPLAAELRQPLCLWYVALARAMRAMMRGRLDEGEELAQQALAIGQRSENKMAPTMFGGQMFRVWAERGQLAELETTMQSMLGSTSALPAARAALAFVQSEIGKLDEARAHLEELAYDDFAAIPREVSWLFGITMSTLVSATLGDAKRAATLYDLLGPFASQLIVLGPPPMACWGPVAHYLGVAATTARRFADAEAHFRSAIATSIRIEAPTFTAQSQIECASMLLVRGDAADRGEARRLAEAASETARQHGLAALEARARSVFTRAVEASAEARFDDRFVREDRSWAIVFDGKSFRLPDSKGLVYIAMLLRHEGTDLAVIDLATGSEPTGREPRRLAALRDELDEAERWSDAGRAERLRSEIDRLSAAVTKSYGLAEKGRAGDEAERARKAVTGRIREAVKRIAAEHEPLAKHLDNALRTGMLCSYRPDRPRNWRL